MSKEASVQHIIDTDYVGTCDMCGVCCTHVSLHSKMPDGSYFTKAAGERCVHLTHDNFCGVWGDISEQPEVCRTIKPTNSLCRFDTRGVFEGKNVHIMYLQDLEDLTR